MRMLCWSPGSITPDWTSCACFLLSCPPDRWQSSSPCSTMWLWALQLLQGPEAKFHPKAPWLCASRAKQNCLEKMDYRTRSYYSTAQGQLYFQCQQVIKVSHFWQEHVTNEIQTIMLGTLMFLQCFNGRYSRTRLTTCSWACFLC